MGDADLLKHAPKRSDYEQARDAALAVELQAQGMTHEEIAAELNARFDVDYSLSRQQIGYDIRKLTEQWRQVGIDNLNEVLVGQIVQLRAVANEAWRAWRKSRDTQFLEEKTVQVLKEYFEPGLDGKPVRVDERLVTESIETIVQQSPGDEKWLKVILDAIEQQNRIYGLNKANLNIQKKETVDITYKRYEVVSPADWDDPTIEVIDGVLYKNGRPLLEGPKDDIVDGEFENGEGSN